jgi:hypothetical protein
MISNASERNTLSMIKKGLEARNEITELTKRLSTFTTASPSNQKDAQIKLTLVPPTIRKSFPFTTALPKVEESTRPWRIETRKLETTPYMYHLDRSHIEIVNLPAPVICRQVCEFARLHSLAAKWSEDEPNRIRLSASEEVEIDITLWRSTEKTNGIIVEARRWKGDGLSAHKLKCILFKSLQRSPQEKKVRFQDAKAMQGSTQDNHVIKMAMRRMPVDPSRFTEAMRTIENATRSMESRSKEEIVSGLKLMGSLTNPSHVGDEISSYVSSIIWTGVDPEKKTRMRATDILRTYALDCSNVAVHFWAVRVLGNVFLCLLNRGGVSILFRDEDMEAWSTIAPMLIDDMESVHSNPHTACFAIRCLRGLIAAKVHLYDKGRRSVFSDHEQRCLKANVEKVVSFGKEKNANIEREGLKLLGILLK